MSQDTHSAEPEKEGVKVHIKKAVAVLGASALTLGLAACGSDSADNAADGGNGGDNYILVNGSEPQRPLLPGDTNETGGGRITDVLYAGLTYYDKDGESHNELAESIEPEGEKSYRVTLKDTKWADGTPVTANDFVDAWNYVVENSLLGAYHFEPIKGYEEGKTLEGLEVVDDKTFTIELAQPEADFPNRLGYASYYPLHPSAYDDFDAYGENPISNGPYKLAGDDAWQHDVQISLVKNEDYQGGRQAQNAGLDIIFYATQDAAYADLQGNKVDVIVAAKGGGSEAKTKFAMLNPSDSIVDWVLKTVPTMGAGWCPPGMLGIGIGGTAEKAAVMAKEVLMEPIDIHELKARGPQNRIEELRLELFEKVNQLGIGAQGLGGLTTVLDVKIMDYPTHAASLPVCMIPNCAATRHAHFVLDGSGPASLEAPPLDAYPEIVWEAGPSARRVDLDSITPEEVQSWKPGETILLNGKMLTGRDAAHKRMVDMLNKGEELPVDLKGRFIYYVGPVDPVGDEVVGPAGPTTATRMDKFTRQILESTGLLGMIGKSERGPIAIEAIKDNKAVYLMAVGGAAYLVAQAIKKSKVLAFAELGMEAIYEFEVKDMPVTVAVDTNGESVHITGPAIWQKKIADSLAVEVQ